MPDALHPNGPGDATFPPTGPHRILHLLLVAEAESDEAKVIKMRSDAPSCAGMEALTACLEQAVMPLMAD